MKHILLVVLVLFSIVSNAQPPGGGGFGVGGGTNGHFFGKIVDSKTGKGLNGATVLLVSGKKDSSGTLRETTIATVFTEANGDFNLEKLPAQGKYTLRVTNIGYADYSAPVAFTPGSFDKDLGNLKVVQSDANLAGVTVTTTAKPFFEMGVDRKIFNVDKNIVTTGQTATEIMKQIPSLNVDVDGNVTLRNAAPTLFVDGRPTTLTLDQIPADIIEKVELVTNPSAKYDASGGNAGILNIVLKKNKKTGYNGNLRAGVDSRGKFNGGADLNFRQNKLNYFLSANANQRKSKVTSSTDRQNFENDLLSSTINQASQGVNNGLFMFFRGGLDYFIDNRNTITLAANFMRGQFKNAEEQTIDSVFSSQLVTAADRLANTKRTFHNFGGQGSYKHNFAKDGHDISADFNYNSSQNDNNGNYDTRYSTATGIEKYPAYLQRTDGGGYNRFVTVQTDYENPLTATSKLELGARAAIRNFKNDNLQYIYDNDVKDYQLIQSISSQYKYTDQVYAAYGTYSLKTKKWNYQVGLRAESSNYNGELLGKDSSFKVKFPVSLFPSAFITYQIDTKQDFQANFSRRINRPNFFQLLPFIDFTDPLNLSVGNPLLRPEFTNSFEVNYSYAYTKGANLLVSSYYKHTDDLITNSVYYDVNPDKTVNTSDSVTFSTYRNAKTSSSYGLEVTNKILLLKIWDMTANINVFNSKIEGDTLNGGDVQRWSWFAKLNNNFKLPKGFSIQLSGDYTSKTVMPASSGSARNGGQGGGWGPPTLTSSQGYIFPRYSADIAIRKEWSLKGGRVASVTLAMNDFLRTQLYKTYSLADVGASKYFTQISQRRRDPQIVRLNFNYRFGKFDANLFKRKSNKVETGGDMNGG